MGPAVITFTSSTRTLDVLWFLKFHLIIKSCTSKLYRVICQLCLSGRRVGGGSSDPLAPCSIIAKQLRSKSARVLGTRKAAVEHQKYVKGTTMYPLEHHPGHGLLCTVPSR